MLGSPKKSPEHLAAVDRVTAWTRARFALAPAAPVLVAELACALPGCAPLETVVAFWTTGAKPHHFKLFKPVTAVTEDDLPPAWMKSALLPAEEFGCPYC